MTIDSWLNQYKIPEKNIPAIEKKNSSVLKILFIISLVFGLLMFLLMTIVSITIKRQPSLAAFCDPAGAQTQNLQTRNLTLYSIELRGRACIRTRTTARLALV